MNVPVHPINYPIDAFPKTVRDAILEVQRNLQAPLPLIAMSFLSAMSATAQAQVKVKHPISGQIKPATLYLFAVADSGERKSTVDLKICAPLKTFDEISQAQYSEALRRYSIKYDRWKDVQRELRKRLCKTTCDGESTDSLAQLLEEHEKLEPIKPRLRRLLLQDTSERALLDVLEGESESVAIMSDEGEIILRSPFLAKHGVINKAWDGGTLSLNRANGVNFSARDPRVTLSIMVQESVLKDFLRKRGEASRGTGFFSRFLMAWPESTQGYRFSSNSEVCWEYLPKFHALISDLLTEVAKDQALQKLPQHIYELDLDAKDDFIKIANWVEAQIQPMQYLHDIHDSASKFGENVLRIAALLHHFSNSAGNISSDTIKRAYDIVNYHVGEFKRIFSPDYEQPQEFKDTKSLIAYLARTVWSQGYVSVSRAGVYRCGPVRNRARFETALATLQQLGIITVTQFGASKTRYIILSVQYFSSQLKLPQPPQPQPLSV